MATEITTVDSQDYKFNPLNFGSLHFTVKASNDAHIALTATAENKPPKYEIFLGGWGNTKSSIRKNNEEPDKVIVDTPKLLNGGEARGFWIKWGGGFIGVGKQGEEKPFMSWQDDESLNVLFYGVRSGWGATGVWTIEDNIYINTEDSKEFIFRAILHGSISFSVDSANDAHIVLATKNKESEPMIEVLLGGWKNTASAIRYNKQTPDKVHVDTPQLLCKDTPKKFVIFWRDGVYEVYGEKTKLFEWKDSNPFSISHYGVRTCWGAVGNWHIHGAADVQFKSQVVATPKPKPLKGKAPPAASPGWNLDGPSSGPVQWIHASNGQIPPNALPGGFDATNEQLYVARAEHNGALIPGKLVPSHGVVYIPWGGVENPKENYEVLCNCNGTWVKANNGEIPVGALSSGHSEDGEPLFVGRGEHNGSLTVGKYKHSSILTKLQKSKEKKKSNITISNSTDSNVSDMSSSTSSNRQSQIQLQLCQLKKISKNKITDLVFDYIVQEMRPLATCQKPSFKRLIMGLAGITDSALLPNTKVISKELHLRYNSYVTMLTDLISKQTYICTTADIWSCNNKSYLGMTCHFLDENTFIRHSYILGCRRIKGSHTYINIAQVFSTITQTFQINNSKISHTVTDNATNFGKAFRIFSTPTIENNNQVITTNSNWFNGTSESSSSEKSDTDDEVEDTSAEVEVVDVTKLISDFTVSNSNDFEDDITLPNHLTCSAHTLSLIATTDVAKIGDKAYNNISKAIFAKLNLFWNLLSRSSVASDKVYEICCCKFPVPIITRWNSMFHAVRKVVANKEKLGVAFDNLKLKKIETLEWSFLEEYCFVMEPLATSLDLLQGENTCFLGYVAPTIIALRLKLIQATHLVYCRPLAFSIVLSLEKRFNYLFNLELSKSKPFILSAISLPKFKLGWVPARHLEMCKKLFLSECNLLNITENNFDMSNESDDSECSDNEFYDILSGDGSVHDVRPLKSNAKSTNLASVQALSYFDTKKKDFNILDMLPIVKKVFLKYNTTLPSSAPVERLFSSGSQILTPRRNRLTDKTFEMLLCCRCLNK